MARGNTYFLSENQTPGHYMDTIAQWLLEGYPRNPTISRYVDAGCAGFIFNSGGMHSTAVDDNEKDGITNPPAAPGNLGHKAEYADDDGGYLRLRCGAYYKHPYPILGKPKGKGRPGAASPADAADPGQSAAAPPVPAVVLPKATPAQLAKYTAMLKSRIVAEVKADRHPRFLYSPLHSELIVDSLGADGVFTLKMADSEATMNVDLFQDLKPVDGHAMALVTLRVNHPEDRALVAFFALACGDAAEDIASWPRPAVQPPRWLPSSAWDSRPSRRLRLLHQQPSATPSARSGSQRSRSEGPDAGTSTCALRRVAAGWSGLGRSGWKRGG